ncbi:MAG: hypothetical protein H7125_00185 [Proteobacteria bacterium]|nr:hypothetical protein [Burkholderiales bacterium]
MHDFDITAALRTAFILAHVLAFTVAASAVAFGDFAIFGRRRVDLALLSKATQIVTFALIALWITGLAVIWLDTRFALAAMMSNQKLLAKLTVVTLLTLNGIALHRLAFPRFRLPQRDPGRAALLSSVLGAISGATWLFAAFIGVGRAVAPALGYSGFMALYAAVVVGGIGFGVRFVRPRLVPRLNRPGVRGRASASS